MKMLGLPNRLGCLQNNLVRLLIGGTDWAGITLLSSHEKMGDSRPKFLSKHGRNYPKIALTKGKTPEKPRIKNPVGLVIRSSQRFFKKCLCLHKHF